MQGDLNAWLGPRLLQGDTRELNANGKLFQKFLEENDLKCVNSLPLTKGIKTRRRKYLDKTIESTINFYVVCESVLPLIKSMEIIDHTNHNLTKYSINSKAVSSDHAPLVMDIELKARPIIREKIEIPNFNDNTAQLKFKEST